MKKLLLILSLAVSTITFAYGSYDWKSGNSYNVNSYGSTTTVNGYNAKTGSTWSQTQNSNGSYNGRDKKGGYYNGNNNTGYYHNSRTGKTCYGKGYARTCY